MSILEKLFGPFGKKDPSEKPVAPDVTHIARKRDKSGRFVSLKPQKKASGRGR